MLGIAHAALVTRDFPRLRAFYTEIFGAEPAYGGDDDTARGGPGFLRIGNLTLHVFERHEDPLGGVSDDEAATAFRRGRIDHIALLPENETEFVAVRDRLVARGASTGEVIDFGAVVSLFATDPDGTLLEVSVPHAAGWDPPFALSPPGRA
jgi:catechol 2,3-dioxygenase-like lactoylglutathione lyase family enzyme